MVLFNSVLKNGDEDQICAFRKWVAEGNTPESFNYIELNGMFLSEEPGEYDYLPKLASAVRSAWQAWLVHCYPEKTFEVYIDDDDLMMGVGFRELLKTQSGS